MGVWCCLSVQRASRRFPSGTCEQQARVAIGFPLMRQFTDQAEDVSVQASALLAKALVLGCDSQCVLALLSSKHFFQSLELEGVPKELKGQGQPGPLRKGRCDPSPRIWDNGGGLSMVV